ncbi:DotU family type IV/VI secretion system protein [Bosea caraganae]|uniref:DotU family type IV/VI secretion system protein n=1 Tax=Bosea caraganae TaxID=2763117 RepID=A0A370L7Q8_9HYPH|nr:type IVB secretion system protein IcmH/DotU [Bosea caraganae]RDJ25090.1 DotU family type IV/VI secretion system protein [Bosea caraganae]RDJ26200.1 DotU family type IV/VI secretion system protein [Bosea caraganae]
MKQVPDPSLDAPTVVGHKPTGLLQPRAPSPSVLDIPTTPIMPPPPRGAGPMPGAAMRAPTMPGFGGTDVAALQPREPAASGPGRSVSMQLASEPTGPADAIIAAAGPLLVLVAQLRDAVEFADVTTLRNEVVNQIQKFEELAVKFGASAGDVTAARYILCSLIDETVMTTPWGSASTWSTSSLLNRFHNETWGGEKVFAILDRIKGDAKKNLVLLKLIDMVLVLGFEGMFRVLDGGRERLADLRDEVGSLVAQHSPPPPSELSAEWRGFSGQRTLRTFLPLWVVFAVTGVLLVCIYGYQRYKLTANLSPVVEQLRGLNASIGPLGGTAP